MKLSEDDNASQYIINHYTQNSLIINKKTHTDSLIISPNYLETNWRIHSINNLSDHLIQPLLKHEPEIILIAFDTRAQRPPANTIACLAQTKIGYEIMSVPAACRTFNLLAAEGRQVAAGFILPTSS